jgi:transposase
MDKKAGKEALVEMSKKELERKRILDQAEGGTRTQREVAEELMISERQVRRMVKRYREQGVYGLISQRRGKPSNRRIEIEVEKRVIDLVRERFYDFGPTLAKEKIEDVEGIKVSTETLRKWMMKEGIWQGKKRRKGKPHQMRERRPCQGELIQIDGSIHDWFEGRGPRCTLIMFIDDATGKPMVAFFAPAETTEMYMNGLRSYLERYGRPVALYADKHSIFHINKKDRVEEGLVTQLGRVAKTLDIELISAHSPQAKGRVERIFGTFQDRVLKEMRLAKISSIEEGNAFLRSYLAQYANRFSKPPRQERDAHRPVLHSPQELDLIFSIHHQRVLSKSLSLQFKNVLYNVQVDGIGYALRGAKVTVCEGLDGHTTLLCNGKPLPYSTIKQGQAPAPIEDAKTINLRVDKAIAVQRKRPKYKPAPDHPWYHQRI